MGTDVDLPTLEAVSKALTGEADDISSIKSPPGDIGAGDLTPHFALATAHLLEQTAQLAGELGGMGEAVLNARHLYEAIDDAARESLEPK